jgi:hypothetical protein
MKRSLAKLGYDRSAAGVITAHLMDASPSAAF